MAVCCALLAAFFCFYTSDPMVLLVQDAFDPMGEVLEPYAGERLERINPYQLGQKIPDLNGMAFLFGPQARTFQDAISNYEYVPLYSAAVVIAVNRNGNSVNAIRGWRTLLESEAVVLIPYNGTEGGRLVAIAIAQALGAKEGDLSPTIKAYADLQAQKRLNDRAVYNTPEYLYMYHPSYLTQFDAVVLWDYQAKALTRLSPDWDVIVPEEKNFTVDCGFVCAGIIQTQADFQFLKEYLQSASGLQALTEAGFSPLAGTVDLSAWNSARLSYNPEFRRSVQGVKLYGPASFQERLFLQSATLLLFALAAQRILRRIPRGRYRTVNFLAFLFVFLWIFLGILKTLTFNPTMVRYLWFATYLPRHILPVCWFCMCYLHRYDRLPSRQILISLSLAALFLTAGVLTNDFHQQVFVYAQADPATWANQYDNGFGYYASLFFGFTLIGAGLGLFVRKEMTRRQKRQLFYAGALLLFLAGYQISYLTGMPYMLDLDIPTTVAIFFLLFSFAAQRERFLGASVLSLPVFQNSSYAISVYNAEGQTLYRNTVMESLGSIEREVSDIQKMVGALDGSADVWAGERAFKYTEHPLPAGRVLLLEDITNVKMLERSLQQTHLKLKALGRLLERQAEDASTLTRQLEQERSSQLMERLFKHKLKEARLGLSRVPAAAVGVLDRRLLKRSRFLICICQQRLRFIIRSLEASPRFPMELIGQYAAGVMQDGQRLGLDGVITLHCRGHLLFETAVVLLEAIDRICLYAFDLSETSLICRLEAEESGLVFNAFISKEGDLSGDYRQILSDSFIDWVSRRGGQVQQKAEEDGWLTRLYFSFVEVTE